MNEPSDLNNLNESNGPDNLESLDPYKVVSDKKQGP